MLTLGIALLGGTLFLLTHPQYIDGPVADAVEGWFGGLEGDTEENWILAGIGMLAIFLAGVALLALVPLWFAAVVYLIVLGTFRIVRWLTAYISARTSRAET